MPDICQNKQTKKKRTVLFKINTFLPITLTLSRWWWGRCEKNPPKEEGKNGGEKSVRSAPAGAGARTRCKEIESPCDSMSTSIQTNRMSRNQEHNLDRVDDMNNG